MACGKACIASDCKTGPFELTEGGTKGLLFPVDDYKELAEQIKKLSTDPLIRNELGKKAREKIINEYDYSKLTKLYASIIN